MLIAHLFFSALFSVSLGYLPIKQADPNPPNTLLVTLSSSGREDVILNTPSKPQPSMRSPCFFSAESPDLLEKRLEMCDRMGTERDFRAALGP